MSQSEHCSNTLPNVCDITFGSLCGNNIALSSAYKINLHLLSMLIDISSTEVKKAAIPEYYPEIHHK